MRKALVSLACMSAGSMLAVLLATACSDDDPAATGTTTPDATPAVDSGPQPTTDAGDSGPPAPAKPGVLHAVLEQAPQPTEDAAPPFYSGVYVADYPGAAAAKMWGATAPKVAIPGAFPGLGCQVSVYGATNPPVSAPDMGDLTLSGFSGGTTLGVDASTYTPPQVCKRVQDPTTMLYSYQCPFYAVPGTNFFDKADTLTFAGAGGADIDSWSLNVKPPPFTDLAVSKNLWTTAATDIDGSQDLTLNYSCDNGGCDQATMIAVFIETTNSTAEPTTPFDFAPGSEMGVASCVQLAGAAANTYTFPKAVLAGLPKTYTAVRISFAVLNANQNPTAKGFPISFVAGFGRFGITRPGT